MPDPGDAVTVDFAGATGVKRRPGIIVSSHTYHGQHPDCIVGLLTSQTAIVYTDTDHAVADWEQSGLRRPSVFRAYLSVARQESVSVIGRLSERDWRAVQACILRAFETG